MRLVVTRPQADGERTAELLRAQGHAVVLAPLMHIETITDAAIGAGPWGAILITSANAAHALATHPRRTSLCGVPVFAAGKRSAQAMAAAGFTDVASAGGGVDDLASLAVARMRPGARLLYLTGEQRAGDLAGVLRRQNFTVHTVAVYRAVAAPKLPEAAADALSDGVDGVLHFSRRSAEAYVHAAERGGTLASALKPVQFCLSAQVAEPLRRAGAAAIRIAPRPEEAELIALICGKTG